MDVKKVEILKQAEEIEEEERKKNVQLSQRLQQREIDMGEAKRKELEEIQKQKDELNAKGEILVGHQAFGYCAKHPEVRNLIIDEPVIGGKPVRDAVNDMRLYEPCPICAEAQDKSIADETAQHYQDEKEHDVQIQLIRNREKARIDFSNEVICKKLDMILEKLKV